MSHYPSSHASEKVGRSRSLVGKLYWRRTPARFCTVAVKLFSINHGNVAHAQYFCRKCSFKVDKSYDVQLKATFPYSILQGWPFLLTIFDTSYDVQLKPTFLTRMALFVDNFLLNLKLNKKYFLN